MASPLPKLKQRSIRKDGAHQVVKCWHRKRHSKYAAQLEPKGENLPVNSPRYRKNPNRALIANVGKAQSAYWGPRTVRLLQRKCERDGYLVAGII